MNSVDVHLDRAQQQVVSHAGGPLLVLAGPGTGKTTTLVEAIAHRIEQGADPASVLALTFSRKAALNVREQVLARIDRAISVPICQTFHSFALTLLQRFAPRDLYAGPLRLLSAPEQDVRLRELLDITQDLWPENLQHAWGTRGFAREVHQVLARAREKGLDGDGLLDLGREVGRPEWVAAGHFLKSYLDVLDQLGATDYSDLMRRAQLEAEAHAGQLRAQYHHVFVDEYQDTDPGQVALLQSLAGGGRNLIAVGDPHQSIYAFRGAEIRGILDFPNQFRSRDQSSAPVIALNHTRRFGPRLLEASMNIAAKLPLTGAIGSEAGEVFMRRQASDDFGQGRVETFVYDTVRAETEHIADLLRRAHLHDGLPWEEMAVLVRSGRNSIPPLRRALMAAGVPVEVAGDEMPLDDDPAVGPLLETLRVSLGRDIDDETHPDYVDAARVQSLLLSALFRGDGAQSRRLGRDLLRLARGAAEEGEQVPSSGELIRRAVLRGDFLDHVDPQHARAAGELNSVVAQLSSAFTSAEGVAPSAEEALWLVWSHSTWGQRLRQLALEGGAAGRRAHRDLDAVVALFDMAARTETQRGHSGVRNFLDTLRHQQIPAEGLAEQGIRGPAVRLLTAHRAKGLQWRLVVVAGVQDKTWPDARRRGSLLGADEIGPGYPIEPTTRRELLAEERRLFYVAVTRARERLVVTAVKSKDDEGEQPSRFLEELTGASPREVLGRPSRPLSVNGLVAHLRRTAADPSSSEGLRHAALRRLTELSQVESSRGRLVPQADPDNWWGLRGRSWAQSPLRAPHRPVSITPSLLRGLTDCPARWFFASEAGGDVGSSQQAGLGQLVHSLAEGVVNNEVEPTIAGLMERVDEVWPQLRFRTPWSAEREYKRTELALRRFLEWHAANPREVVATECRLSAVVQTEYGPVELGGRVDRLDRDSDGALVVVDYKTGRKHGLTKKSLPEDMQLGLYQYALTAGAAPPTDAEGALDAATQSRQDAPASTCSGGAELVFLGIENDKPADVWRQQPHDPQGPERDRLNQQVGLAAQMLKTEVFPTNPGNHCRSCPFTAICPATSSGSVLS